MTPLRHALFALTLTLPQAAPALVLDPVCAVDAATGTIHPIAESRGTDVVWPQGYPGGIVVFDWIDDEQQMHGIVQHCPTGTSLRYRIAYARHDALRGRLEAMLTSDIVYGFDDLRQEIRISGGRARMVPAPGRCGCDHATGF